MRRNSKVYKRRESKVVPGTLPIIRGSRMSATREGGTLTITPEDIAKNILGDPGQDVIQMIVVGGPADYIIGSSSNKGLKIN